ncbi:MAG: reverse transcriptase family protein, partial [Cyanobacteria bacterium J06649_11]
MKQAIKKSTRTTDNSSTLIDLIITNYPERLNEIKVITSHIADHDMIFCSRKINNIRHKEKNIKCRNYTNYSPERLREDVSKIDWNPVYNSTEVESAVNIFTSALQAVFDKNAPQIEKRIKGRPCSWMDEDTKRLMNKRDQAFRKSRRSKNPNDRQRYKLLRNQCTSRIKKAKSTHHKNILNENANNPKKFWSAIKTIFPGKSTSKIELNSRPSANTFSRYFSKMAFHLKEKTLPLTNFIWRTIPRPLPRTVKKFKFNYVSILFVQKELKLLSRKKATGIDDLPPGLLKDCDAFISQPLCHIINLSLQTGSFPTNWKSAKVTPLFKSGSSSLPENFRPISVLPILSKILEKSVHFELKRFLENENLLTKHQHGFRKKHSTKTASILFSDKIRKEMDNVKLTGAVYVDLSKAFDTISRGALLEKLQAYGIERNEYQWFCSYLFNRKITVTVDQTISSEEPVTCGVPQGSILGPLLFIIFINDMGDHLQYVSMIMYADDTVLFFYHKNKSEIERCLNVDMDNLCEYFRQNELVINLKPGKTETILFGTCKRLKNAGDNLEVLYDGVKINFTKTYKYLGNILDSNLHFNLNFESSYKKASGRLRLLERMRFYLTTKAARLIYIMMIVPIITAGCTLKSPYNATQSARLLSLD